MTDKQMYQDEKKNCQVVDAVVPRENIKKKEEKKLKSEENFPKAV